MRPYSCFSLACAVKRFVRVGEDIDSAYYFVQVIDSHSNQLSLNFSSKAAIHDVELFLPSPNRIHRVLLGTPAGSGNTLLRGAWIKDNSGRRVGMEMPTAS